MNGFVEGSVVICCDTGQSGCVVYINKSMVCVLLRNMDLWYGAISVLREPQGQDDLNACPLEMDLDVKFKKNIK